MKFSRVIGKIDPELVAKAEDMLSKVFLEMALKYGADHIGSIGGDPFLFSMLQPMQHVATLNLPTAATDGKRYYWNPNFILSMDRIGVRMVASHEACHCIYMHPLRRGSRNPKLWNIAVDYIVNGFIMEDLIARKKDAAEMFRKHLGNFVTLPQYLEHIKNPFAPMPGSENWTAGPEDPNSPKVTLPKPEEERELTDEEKKEIERQSKKYKCYFADPALPDDMKKPEKIYDLLFHALPKCPECGKIGIYKMPKKKKKDKDQESQDAQGQDSKGKKGKKSKDSKDSPGTGKGKGKKGKKSPGDSEQDKEEQENEEDQNNPDNHDHGDGDPCDHQCGDHGDEEGDGDSCSDDGCDSCSGGYDIFGMNGYGSLVDDHMDANETPEKMAKRIADAMRACKEMAGHVPAGLEEELGDLMSPRVRWQDFIRAKLIKSRIGNSKNDWTRFKSRQLFAGLLNPKRKSFFSTFGCLLDTSGSMSNEDMTFGISQLQSIDEKSEGHIVCGDAEIYWEEAKKLRKMSPEELNKLKVVGRGGTMFSQFFEDYEEHFGKCDFLVVITDGFLMDQDVAEMKDPGIDVIWLITSGHSFNAPFGRVFDLQSL